MSFSYFFARLRNGTYRQDPVAWTHLHIAELEPLFSARAPMIDVIGAIAFVNFLDREQCLRSYFILIGIGFFCDVTLCFCVYSAHIL